MMSHLKVLYLMIVIGVVFLVSTASQVEAGECSGVVVYKDGSKYSKSGISALVSGGGVTKKFYTDRNGRFTIKWSSKNSLAKIFVKGKTVATNIKHSTENLRLVVK